MYEILPQKKAPKGAFLRREDRIRTCDPLVPNQMRYHLRYFPRAAKVNNVAASFSARAEIHKLHAPMFVGSNGIRSVYCLSVFNANRHE